MQPLSHESDERILVEAAQRDPSRFAELYERNFDRVYAYVSRRLTDRSAVEDVTAEVFRQALANLGQFEWRGSPFVAWLVRIAANAVTDHWRRVSREQPMLEADGPESAPSDPASIDAVERRALLFRLVRSLPADQRRVIEMRFAQEKGVREIARELNRSEGAVKQLQFRAIQNLRAHLQKSPDKKKSSEANA
ncbi:MAG TPA: sigma-70 family RNA polymerase sigma factor [Candidatus Acidoferrum sp.]